MSVEEARHVINFLCIVLFPFGVWALISLWRETERRAKNCGDCITCSTKWKQQEVEKLEATARNNGRCIRGHGYFARDGRCPTCGWS